jgi:hypothetical protein
LKLRKYICPYDGCNAAFGQKTTMQIHCRQHTG